MTVTLHPPAIDRSQPNVVTPGETTASHRGVETHSSPAGTPPTTSETQPRAGSSGATFVDPPARSSSTNHLAGAGGFHNLRVWADSYADASAHEIVLANRFRQCDPAMYEDQLAAVTHAKKAIKKALLAEYRNAVPQPIRDWQKYHRGIGDHLLARLLGRIGHPRIAEPYHWEGTGTNRKLVADAPYERTVAQLWAYCGHGDPARRKRKGMTADEAFALGSPDAKMLVWNLAVACMKQVPKVPLDGDGTDQTSGGDQGFIVGAEVHDPSYHPHESQTDLAGVVILDSHARGDTQSPRAVERVAHSGDETHEPGGDPYLYRHIYDLRRLQTHDRTHTNECARCGPSGRPAPVGSPWSKAHQQADALRIVGKNLLRDLWIVAGQEF